ncbi:MAG: glycosyltransferase family 1 protein, partial [Bacteroidia bacterium]|nr:glycosyltransferase family 1 protein [Bacteroidia bacterium]
MKILYFILGSFEAKLGHWGYNSFHDFLQEDIIFFGPINEESFDHQGKRYPLIRFFKETSIDEIFAQLPENWIPDIVHCETTVMIFVPDIHKCPVKTCLNTADSWSSIVYNKKIACFFDTVRYGVIDKDEYVACKSTLLSTVNCAVSIPESDILPEDFSKRKIDILAIAKYDSGFYHDRYNAFFQASSSLNTKYRIRFINSVKRHQIHQYYQRSKIILDWAHTPSNRSYEAALNGCLLFCNEENTRIPEIWTPWEEYIPYNSSNLIELLDEYLSNPEKSRIIINNARKKLNLIPYTWGNTLLSQLKEALAVSTSLSDRIERIENMPAETFYSCLATPLYYNYFY